MRKAGLFLLIALLSFNATALSFSMPVTSSPEAHQMIENPHHLQLNCQDQTRCGLADSHCAQFQSACPIAPIAHSNLLPHFKRNSTPYNRTPLPGFNKRAEHPPKAS